MRPYVYIFSAIVTIIVGVCMFAQQKQDCDARGGILLRGVMGYECVKAVLP